MKNALIALLLMGCAALSVPVLAQEYPNKPIKIVVPYPPGGVTDVATRLVAAKMSESLGQAVYVENQPAAGGVLGANRVAKAAPDGYTLMGVFDSFATNHHLYKGVEHDPIKSFTPISLMVRSPQLLVVHPGLGVKTVADLIRLAKEKGDRLAFSTPGAGTSSRLSSELFKQAAEVDFTLVFYKGGAAAVTDLIGGQVGGMLVSMSLVLPYVQQGRLLALGVTSPKRSPQLPDVPPIADTLPGFDAQSWTGMVAPAGTPRAIIDKLHSAVTKALAAPDVRDKLSGQGVEVVASTPEAFADLIARDGVRWGAIIRQRKITID